MNKNTQNKSERFYNYLKTIVSKMNYEFNTLTNEFDLKSFTPALEIFYVLMEQKININIIDKRGYIQVESEIYDEECITKNIKYRTTLEFFFRENKPVNIATICNCRDYNNCVHGLALFFISIFNKRVLKQLCALGLHQLNDLIKGDLISHMLNELKNNEISTTKNQLSFSPVVKSWLYNLKKYKTKESVVNDRPIEPYYMIYYLILDWNYELQLSLKCAQKKKRLNGYKGEKDISRMKFDMDQIEMDQTDKAIYEFLYNHIIHLQKNNSYYLRDEKYYTIHGEQGENVLKLLLKSNNRTFFEYTSHNNFLKFQIEEGEDINGKLIWKKNEKNQLSMQFEALSQKYMVLNLANKMYYIDFINKTIGLIKNSPLNVKELALFKDLPPVSEEELQVIAPHIIEAVPMTLDLLQDFAQVKSQKIENIKPTITLKVQSIKQNIESNVPYHRRHFVQLLFNYNKFQISPQSQSELEKQDHVVKKNKTFFFIQRDLGTEKQALQELLDKGFTVEHALEGTPQGLNCIFNIANKIEFLSEWENFIENIIPDLKEKDWNIQLEEEFDLKFQQLDEWFGEINEEKNDDWFELILGVEFEGKKYNLLPVIIDILTAEKKPSVAIDKLKKMDAIFFEAEEKWLKLPVPLILNVLETIIELYDKEPLNKNHNLSLSKYSGMHLNKLFQDAQIQWKGTDELVQLSKQIEEFQGIKEVPLPNNLQAELRPYQEKGFYWLQFLREYNFNGILADEMGLGKTIQTITNLLYEKQSNKAFKSNLIIAPTSLMSNWKNECQRFAPDLKVLVLYGVKRIKNLEIINTYDVILTTYNLIVKDQENYLQSSFHYIILDESQMVKNIKTKASNIISQIKANHKLCLTGTPMENHLGELWAMFHFLMPGYLGNQRQFKTLFRTPIENENADLNRHQLQKRVEPFLLRRTKELVAKDLPEKTEIHKKVELKGKQLELYESVRLSMDKRVQEEISQKGLSRSHIIILDALLKLRQVCCDPSLVKMEKAKNINESAKLELLMTILPDMISQGRKILLFSQFTSMLAIIEKEIIEAGYQYCMLTGKTKNRGEVIDEFQKGEKKIFLISLKSGGFGLNLTAADTVIHYDPWWNPAVEKQATDRAHRIGQEKPVFVYKLITENTVEDKIVKLQEKKEKLSEALYNKNANTKAIFTQDDLKDLLQPIEKQI